jgi:hypothetical protein
MNGSTYEDYQTAKYEFYNKVLDNDQSPNIPHDGNNAILLI